MKNTSLFSYILFGGILLFSCSPERKPSEDKNHPPVVKTAQQKADSTSKVDEIKVDRMRKSDQEKNDSVKKALGIE